MALKTTLPAKKKVKNSHNFSFEKCRQYWIVDTEDLICHTTTIQSLSVFALNPIQRKWNTNYSPLKAFIFVLDLDMYHSSLTNSPAFIFSTKFCVPRA